MITEDYVSFETAKLLKEKEFDGDVNCTHIYAYGKVFNKDDIRLDMIEEYIQAPTLQMAMKWLREVHNVLLVVDYEWECDTTPYFFKIYRLGDNGKPERIAIAVKAVSYDKDDNPIEDIVCYRDWERSYGDYSTYEEAREAGIKYCLENLI